MRVKIPIEKAFVDNLLLDLSHSEAIPLLSVSNTHSQHMYSVKFSSTPLWTPKIQSEQGILLASKSIVDKFPISISQLSILLSPYTGIFSSTTSCSQSKIRDRTTPQNCIQTSIKEGSNFTYKPWQITEKETGGTLGIDLRYPWRRPIYFFQAMFDNIVIVPESEFSPANTKARGLENYGSVFIRKRKIVQLGQRPWFCSWNGTLLDISIYANETSDGGSQ
ncbi:uncharacterized protein EAE98_008555 [Botrytis deweyae]|uniref:DUF7820 domain-containing protein n=1 Tax=Botrytis deweyae TaxID=2478750 RepID=A0ABQ7IEW4_9HELO|nr:uncharacterized protein EAE98_008555 [Botrytis deweyae]KAF7921708.1 hypothetical protein EAE98_008555 [Botrytis deweyae]